MKEFEVLKIIHNKKATVVFWGDGTKTVVKCADETNPDNYNAFCAALAKKIYKNNSHLKKIIKDAENAKMPPLKNMRKYTSVLPCSLTVPEEYNRFIVTTTSNGTSNYNSVFNHIYKR